MNHQELLQKIIIQHANHPGIWCDALFQAGNVFSDLHQFKVNLILKSLDETLLTMLSKSLDSTFQSKDSVLTRVLFQSSETDIDQELMTLSFLSPAYRHVGDADSSIIVYSYLSTTVDEARDQAVLTVNLVSDDLSVMQIFFQGLVKTFPLRQK